jgi:K+-sensing histidine kinase KdpD
MRRHLVMTVLCILVSSLLWRKFNLIPDPGLILLLTVALTTYITGGMPGMLSAAIVLFGSFILFSHPLYLFRYTELDWRQVMAISVACPMIALMVGSLKDQVDRLKKVTAENEQLRLDIRRFEGLKEAYHLCEQRFEIIAENVKEYAVFMLDLNGVVVKWTRFAGHVDKADWNIRKDGKQIRVRMMGNQIKNSAWHPIGFLMIMRDLGYMPEKAHSE